MWKFLLGYFQWDSTKDERDLLLEKSKETYEGLKKQWQEADLNSESNHLLYERKNRIEKDVNRTDRTIDFYSEAENSEESEQKRENGVFVNPNLNLLLNILMTYSVYDNEVGQSVITNNRLCARYERFTGTYTLRY